MSFNFDKVAQESLDRIDGVISNGLLKVFLDGEVLVKEMVASKDSVESRRREPIGSCDPLKVVLLNGTPELRGLLDDVHTDRDLVSELVLELLGTAVPDRLSA